MKPHHREVWPAEDMNHVRDTHRDDVDDLLDRAYSAASGDATLTVRLLLEAAFAAVTAEAMTGQWGRLKLRITAILGDWDCAFGEEMDGGDPDDRNAAAEGIENDERKS